MASLAAGEKAAMVADLTADRAALKARGASEMTAGNASRSTTASTRTKRHKGKRRRHF
jgi:hypothetical protein